MFSIKFVDRMRDQFKTFVSLDVADLNEVDVVPFIEGKLKPYKETGEVNWLVRIANLTIIQVMKNEMNFGLFLNKMKQRMLECDNYVMLDITSSLEQRLEIYKETENSKWLVDVANLAMIEGSKKLD